MNKDLNISNSKFTDILGLIYWYSANTLNMPKYNENQNIIIPANVMGLKNVFVDMKKIKEVIHTFRENNKAYIKELSHNSGSTFLKDDTWVELFKNLQNRLLFNID